MRGFTTSITVVVAAIVILITAIVVIGILTGGIGTISTITQQKNICITQATAICTTTGGTDPRTGTMPPGWRTQPYAVKAEGSDQKIEQTCFQLTGFDNCQHVIGEY